jgi:ankyrin repeat protein
MVHVTQRLIALAIVSAPSFFLSAMDPETCPLSREKAHELLLEASYRGDLHEVKRALVAGANVNAKDSGGGTALHRAALRGYVEIARELISQGALVTIADSKRRTPLHQAAQGTSLEMVRELLNSSNPNRRSNPNLYDNNEETPLHYAVEYGRIEIVKELLARGAGVHVLNVRHNTPLHSAARRGYLEIADY